MLSWTDEVPNDWIFLGVVLDPFHAQKEIFEMLLSHFFYPKIPIKSVDDNSGKISEISFELSNFIDL